MIRLRLRWALFVSGLVIGLTAPLSAQRAVPGLDAAGMDTTVKPGDDFFRYASGTWFEKTVIPPDRGSVGAFSVAAQNAERQLTEIVTGAAAHPAAVGTDLRRIGDYYTAYLDTTAMASRGLSPLKPLLDQVAAIHDRASLARFIG